MRAWKKFSVIALVVLSSVTLICSAVLGWRPLIGARSRALRNSSFESTDARRERGRYLVEHVARCPYCHSELDWAASGAPPRSGKAMAGRIWKLEGFPWLVSPNLTPDKQTGAGTWTDDMLARAIREGIGHDGRALFPTMPYQSFQYMSDEDLASIITYVRSVEPIHNPLPKTTIPFPTSRLILNAPQPIVTAILAPEISNRIDRGAYLLRVSACEACHTVQNYLSEPVRELRFAGGFVFQTPLGIVASPNITSDPTGISYYDEEMFLRVIRSGSVGARKLNPEMPWGYFRGMSDDDLRAIFAYLRTLKPIKHSVDNTEPRTYCKTCRQVHGAGIRN
jgi:mono/diheme cytochrome c family protein